MRRHTQILDLDHRLYHIHDAMLTTQCYATKDGRKSSSQFQRRSDFDLPEPEVPAQDVTSCLGRVRKALAYWRKHTKLPRSQSRSESRQDVGLSSMSSGSSSLSRRKTHRRRPTALSLEREESSSSGNDPSCSTYDDDKDPFITSPSWLKDTYFEGETRQQERRSSEHAVADP
ncbi:hypothetical protein HBI56_082310 [Parastagonospora nodorum]|nr:hypothetical protein HBH51_063620 [Parastagonospora nodorum]KAH4032414.1 hypothetical protein HBI09_118560 [Parastagonospora nodorum]KAH4049320.1 hypothetical protein HBH49_145120 [Parastagonospora nodorum]KAH4098671.1 hypothetical protein HBH46_158230 [Parastagonospora nodorum]KAH4191253.1 hypothetical protein HBH42_122670 [Parastagonospora nodorum]